MTEHQKLQRLGVYVQVVLVNERPETPAEWAMLGLMVGNYLKGPMGPVGVARDDVLAAFVKGVMMAEEDDLDPIGQVDLLIKRTFRPERANEG